jgi:hypothetical protein
VILEKAIALSSPSGVVLKNGKEKAPEFGGLSLAMVLDRD